VCERECVGTRQLALIVVRGTSVFRQMDRRSSGLSVDGLSRLMLPSSVDMQCVRLQLVGLCLLEGKTV